MLGTYFRGSLRLSTKHLFIFAIVAGTFILIQLYLSVFFDVTSWNSFGSQNIPNSSKTLKDILHALVSNEVARLLRLEIPVVEDVGETIVKSWIELEKSFCQTVLKEKYHHKSCQTGCRINESTITSRRVAIIIPFRNRHTHLQQILPRLEQLLDKQNLCYLIVVSEQSGEKPFNKGILMNSAFIEALKWFPFHCAIFHDVDLIPLNDDVPYSCALFPRHISVTVDKFNNRLPYIELIGGVLSVPLKAFLRVNGFSNMYWGWGAEDDDMYERLMTNKIPITRPDPKVARFTMLNHTASPAFSIDLRSKILSLSRARFRLDGLNSLNYTVKNFSTYYGTSLVPSSNNRPIRSHASVPSQSCLRLLHLVIDVGPLPQWLV